MHPLISFDRKIVSAADAEISALSSAALYGRGIFTTVAIYDRQPFLWKSHWRRLRDSAGKLRIDLSEFSEEVTRNALDEIVDRNSVENGRARTTCFDRTASNKWPFESVRKTSLLISTAEARDRTVPFKLGVSSFSKDSRSFFSQIKSCNYLENVLAFEEATGHGLDEEVRLNERGEIVSACMANIFWSKDGELFTPSIKTGCLPGTTREFVMKNLKCSEVEAELDQLYLADSIFMTSAGIGIGEVRFFQGLEFRPSGHKILDILPKPVNREKNKNTPE